MLKCTHEKGTLFVSFVKGGANLVKWILLLVTILIDRFMNKSQCK